MITVLFELNMFKLNRAHSDLNRMSDYTNVQNNTTYSVTQTA